MKAILIGILMAASTLAQTQVNQTQEFVQTQVVRAPVGMPTDGGAPPVHPFTVVARHPKAGCDNTAECGEIFYTHKGHNLRTSAGTTWQYNQMAGTTAAVGTYMALTNTAITPAFADTTLSGEIAVNGLERGLADTVTNGSTTLAVPAAATATVVGTTGSTSYYYWVAACNQGICTTPSAASNNVTTANATLSTTNYVSVAFTAVAGASTYQVYRTTTSAAPTTGSVLVGGQPACTAAGNCVVLDTSNTLSAVTIPGSNLTNYGKYVLVKTWTCSTASQSAQAFGIFNASSNGTMIFEGTFTQVNLNVGDTFQLTWTAYF